MPWLGQKRRCARCRQPAYINKVTWWTGHYQPAVVHKKACRPPETKLATVAEIARRRAKERTLATREPLASRRGERLRD